MKQYKFKMNKNGTAKKTMYTGQDCRADIFFIIFII